MRERERERETQRLTWLFWGGSYFIPDYTAYNEMMSSFSGFAAVPSPLYEEDGYSITPDKIRNEVKRGSSVILTSNPRNPTGRVVKGKELKEIQEICREKATLIMDEFYSGYYYGNDCDGTTISSAEYVEGGCFALIVMVIGQVLMRRVRKDVNEDDVLIIDGLTKRFRLPGWRIAVGFGFYRHVPM